MSRLQDALKRTAIDEQVYTADENMIRNAARKYANPDYEAGARRRFEDVNARFDTEWPDLRAEEQDEWIAEVKPYIEAALGITGDLALKG